MERATGRATKAFRAVFTREGGSYAGASLETSQRMVAGLLGLTALLTVPLIALDPPSAEIGAAGWLIAAALVAADAVVVSRLADPGREASFGALLIVAYAAVGQIALLTWLSGGSTSTYDLLYVLWIGGSAMHPPRRALTHLGTILVALSLPLFYDAYDSAVATDLAGLGLLILAAGAALIAALFQIRSQRLELRAGQAHQRMLARVDALTGLANRRAFEEDLAVEMSRVDRDGTALSVGLLDLDGLKRINDNFGHLEGDESIRRVARVIEDAVRGGDRCFRWAGDEYAVLFARTDVVSAERVLHRVAEEVSSTCEDPDGDALSISWGAAELEPGGSAEDLVALADLALFQSKAEAHSG